MPVVKHQILPPYRNSDMTAVTDNMWKVQDGVMHFNPTGNKVSLVKRPGLLAHVDLNTNRAIDGIHWFEKIQAWITVSDGRIFSVSDRNGSFSEITSATLMPGEKCFFAEVWDQINGEVRLFIANGGQIVWTNGTTTTYVTGGIAPAHCTHVAQIDTYLAFNDLDTPGFWKHSAEGDPTNMTAGAARTMAAQRIPDDIIGLFVRSNLVYVCGTRSIELFQNTGDTIPFSSVGVTIDTGIMNKTAFSLIDGQVFLFNQNRQLIRLEGYSPVVKSISYQFELDSLGAVNDLDMQTLTTIGGRQYVLLNFNDQKKTFVFDIQIESFYEWGNWVVADNGYDMFKGRGYAYARPWGQHLVGDNSIGIVYLLSPDYKDDNGTAIKTYFEFGRKDHGTKSYKFSNSLYLDIKRGQGLSSDKYTAAKAQLYWRDDGGQIYGNFVELDLGKVGEYRSLPKIPRMGRYRDRQYKLVIGDSVDFSLNGIEEDVFDTGRL